MVPPYRCGALFPQGLRSARNPIRRAGFAAGVMRARMASKTTLNCASCFFSRAASFQPNAPTPRNEERPALTVVDTPAVDSGVLEDLGRLSPDPTFVERLIRGFRSDTERLVKAISDALATRRYEDVKDAAHALKGGAGSVGATQLVSLALRFEEASYDTLRIKAAMWTEELSRAADNALGALETHVEERRHQQSGSS